jgi:hypothetical protein
VLPLEVPFELGPLLEAAGVLELLLPLSLLTPTDSLPSDAAEEEEDDAAEAGFLRA